jgi:hypothetical protein
MRAPLRVLGAALGAWIVVACLDVSSPVTGISGISNLILPTPSVVEHDVSRDTGGDTAALKVYVFGPNGDTVRDAVVRFLAIDSTKQLHVDSMTGIVTADTFSPAARVVARVTPASGKGFIQTALIPLPIVRTPVSAARDTDFVFTANISSSATPTDTLASGLISPGFGVIVRSGDSAGVAPYVVSFKILNSPGTTGEPLVKLAGASGRDSTIAVTDGSGHATIHLRLRPHATDSDLLLGKRTDTAIVRVYVQYRGTPLPITPPDSFVIPIRVVSTP